MNRTSTTGPIRKKAGYVQAAFLVAAFVMGLDLLAAGGALSVAQIHTDRQQELTATAPIILQEEPMEGFAAVYYYEAENADRYTAYQTLHPELSIEDVVWQVNANLDWDFYTNIQAVENPEAVPVIVNKYYALAADYVPPDMVQLPSGKYATKETHAAYMAMSKDMEAEGMHIYAASAYRSYDYQHTLYNKYLQQEGGNAARVDTYSARPGHSEHQTGRAIDLCGSSGSLNDFINTKEGPWVNENCYRYGFIVRYQAENVAMTGYKYEPWHITYVGVEIATAMHDLGIKTLEEYMVKYVTHQPPVADVTV